MPAINPKTVKVERKNNGAIIARWKEIDPAYTLCSHLAVALIVRNESAPLPLSGANSLDFQGTWFKAPAHMSHVYIPSSVVDQLKSINPKGFHFYYQLRKSDGTLRRSQGYRDKLFKWGKKLKKEKN